VDVAIATQVWAPLSANQGQLVGIVFEERAQALGNIRRHLAAGHPVWTENWRATGGDERAALDDAWLEEHRDMLIAAVAVPPSGRAAH